MNIRVAVAFKRAFFPIAILGTTLLISAVSVMISIPIAIKGSYTLLGLLVAATVYYTSHEGSPYFVSFHPTHLRKLTAIFITMSIPLTLFTDSRLPALLFIVPLGYLCVWLQIDTSSPASIIPQLIGLYLVSPVTKVLMSGIYFENGDVFDHIRYVDLLLATGSIEAIPRYEDYPGYHLLTGIASVITELDPYQAMEAVQLLIFSVFVVVIYLLGRSVFKNDYLALLTSFALTVTYAASQYITIYFPQSIAVILVTYILYLSFKLYNSSGETFWAIAILLTITGVMTILTHHLTLLMFIPFVGIILLGRNIMRRLKLSYSVGPKPLPLVALGFGAVIYWIYERDFLLELVWHTTEVFFETSVAEGENWRVVIGLGETLPTLNHYIAARSLVSLEGIYFILLICVIALGLVRVFSFPKSYQRATHFIAAGLFTVPLILPSPIAPDTSRIRLPLIVFFVFVAALGLEQLRRTEFDTRIFRVVPIGLVVVLATTSGLVASGDLYGFNTGPDLYELQPLPEPEVELSDKELQELQETSRYIHDYDGEDSVSSLTITSRALGMFGVNSEEAIATETQLEMNEELFVYREAWTEHRVSFVDDNIIGTVVISEAWLKQTVGTENKIYTAGSTGILWLDESGESVSPNEFDEADEPNRSTREGTGTSNETNGSSDRGANSTVNDDRSDAADENGTSNGDGSGNGSEIEIHEPIN